ncbi:unnamed protein product [Vicia faba]|uniref:Uncharacterized protein n=1 Tax=Vicia faba TaxID=3906 RepID=A0AAV0YQ03_VICFA|nr:unnamed protein product [Vicia faba]
MSEHHLCRLMTLNMRDTLSPTLSLQDIVMKTGSVESCVTVKKPDPVIIFYLGPSQTPNVEPNVGTYAKDYVISNVVGNIRIIGKFISENMNDVNGFVDVSLSKILVLKPDTYVVPDVITFLAQTDNPDIKKLNYDNEHIWENWALGIEPMVSKSKPSKDVVESAKDWIKVVTSAKKRKEASSSDSESLPIISCSGFWDEGLDVVGFSTEKGRRKMRSLEEERANGM